MCKHDPTTWEDLASQRWEELSQVPGETLDSTTGRVLDPVKVQEGCDEEMGFMTQDAGMEQGYPRNCPERPRRKHSGNQIGVGSEGR